MPNRILREGICTSETINSLSADEEVLFYRLLVTADDYGVMDARPAILKARCFPLRPPKDVALQNWLSGLRVAGLIAQYEVEGKPYLCVAKWDQHQRLRKTKRRYPPPPDDNLMAVGGELPQVAASSGLNPNPNPNPNPKVAASAAALPAGNGVGIVYIPLNDGKEYPIVQADVDELERLYPALDVVQTLREIRGWNLANATRRKTKAGVMRHVHSWFAKEQNKAH